jgi:hypothetical protein
MALVAWVCLLLLLERLYFMLVVVVLEQQPHQVLLALAVTVVVETELLAVQTALRVRQILAVAVAEQELMQLLEVLVVQAL